MAVFVGVDDDEQLLLQQIVNDAEEAEQEAARPPRRFWNQIDPFEVTEESFVKNYRLSKHVARALVEELTPFLIPPTRTSAVGSTTKVLVALNFFGQGSYQEGVGKHIFSALSQSTVSRCIEEVCNALCNEFILNRCITFPNNLAQLRELRNRFYQKYEFPGVVGCVDGTHIAISRPNENEHVYINRKHFHSINVQVICDENLKILSLNTQFPGSCHYAYIWRQSNVSNIMEQIFHHYDEPFFLLGDAGYPLRPWLLTAIEDALPGTAEERFSNHLRSVRSSIERCIGLWKNRFRCLLKHRTLHYTPINTSKIALACAVLHNICINNNMPHPEIDYDNDFNMFNIDVDQDLVAPEPAVNPMLTAAIQLRSRIIRTHYQ